MKRKVIKKPVTIGTLTNKASEKRVRRRKTRRFALKTGSKEIRKGRLNLGLDMRRKKRKPNAQRVVVAKGMEGGNETTIILSVLNDEIPPGRKVADSVGVQHRKELAKLFLSLGVETTIGEIGQEEFTIHLNCIRANGMMDKNTVVRTRSRPREDGTSSGIDNHVGGIMDVTLKVLPVSTLPKLRKSGAVSK
jgi:hypothetical protein